MANRLVGINTKLERAKKHILHLKADTDRFTETNPYELFSYDDPDTGDEIIAVHVHRELSPDLAAIVGDVLNNLRTPLDYLIYELASGKGNDHLAFPISQTESGFKGNVNGPACP